MEITMNKKYYTYNYAGLEAYTHDVKMFLAKKHGIDAAERMIDPLTWWVFTGRATLTECKALVEKRPYVIGKILEKGGTINNQVDAIKRKIGT